MVFPTFFNLSLNLTIRSSWSEPQSALGLVFADCICFSIFGCKEYNQSNFSVDHLVMSMCRVFFCVVGRGCLLWPERSLGKTLISLCPASFCTLRPNLPVTPEVSWLPTFAFQSPIMKKTSFGGICSRRSCSISASSALVVGAQTWITGEALYSKKKKNKTRSWLAQIMNSLLSNSDLNWRKWGKPLDHSGMT